MSMIPKHLMSEEDIKLQFITPAITAKWDISKITMETKLTDGKINLKGNLVVREKPKRADYVLYLAPNTPIAIIEAKDNNHSVSYGLQQAMAYAKMLDLPFAYSSNGDGFAEHDFLTGKERQFGMDEFPTEEELIARYKIESGLTPKQDAIQQQPYYSSQNTYPPRYYQRIAINRTVDAIARGQDRLLLVMATGTGKTYTAFQIVYRLLKSGLKRKVLYLADRNILVDQSIQQDFSPLEKTIHKINFAKDDPVTITSHEVYFSLYQQLAGNEENEDEGTGEEAVARFAKLFNKDFFDLIIVDECHRGSAKKDSNWRKILDYFSSATQIGMTATPKETKYISNIDYFGEPVYTYSLREGIEDGFLAPFKVINIKTDISDGWRPCKGQLDKFGNEIEDRIYTNSDFDYNIILEDRTYEVAKEITEYLKSTDRMQKTIVFCATEDHAERMRIALNNLNADMVKENPDYVVRITGSDTYGKSKLDYFISVSAPYPVIATTSKLLSTGADCKMTKLIVLDEMISSMTEFKQIIGRGTRLREKEGKSHFVVMDFRNVTRLFSDPDWDGPIEMVDGYDPEHKPTPRPPKPGNGDDPITPPTVDKYIVDENGCDVHIIGKRVEVYDVDGKLLRQESIVDYTKSNILGKYASLDNFILKWTSEE
ncbi:MAG: DEAD/DEAH box helicase family protein, partial [Clostridia bacterium]|nr:DEAD/DEAH box helicase family protein [Clostridia bacterium]